MSMTKHVFFRNLKMLGLTKCASISWFRSRCPKAWPRSPFGFLSTSSSSSGQLLFTESSSLSSGSRRKSTTSLRRRKIQRRELGLLTRECFSYSSLSTSSSTYYTGLFVSLVKGKHSWFNLIVSAPQVFWLNWKEWHWVFYLLKYILLRFFYLMWLLISPLKLLSRAFLEKNCIWFCSLLIWYSHTVAVMEPIQHLLLFSAVCKKYGIWNCVWRTALCQFIKRCTLKKKYVDHLR